MLSNNVFTDMVSWYQTEMDKRNTRIQIIMYDIFLNNFTNLCVLCEHDRQIYVSSEITRIENEEYYRQPPWCPLAGLEDCKCSYCEP